MFFWVILLVLLADQVSKYVVHTTMIHGASVVIIPSVLSLTCVYNSGAAFGLFAEKTGYLIVLTVILILGVIIGYRKLPLKRPLVLYGVAFIVGGGLGNLLDRLRHGYVVDFFDLHFWPVFNLADVAIVVGAGLLFLDLWLTHRREKEMESNV